MTSSRLDGPLRASQWPSPDPLVADGRRIALFRPAGGREGPASDVPILFVHGLRERAESWRQVAGQLAPGQRMLAPDLPGFGESEAAGEYDQASVAAVLAALIVDVIDGPVDVVGCGWGATLAIALAATRADLIRRLVVISGPWPPALAAGPTHPAPGLTPRLRLSAGPGRSLQSRIRRAYLAAGEFAGAPRPERSLVIWGARDRVLPPRYGEQVVTALGRCVDPATVEMITFPGLGGSLIRTAPEVVASALREFLLAS